MTAAAESRGLTERHLRQLLFERRVAFHKVGRLVFVDLDDLDDFLEVGRVEPRRTR
ncbi:MAG: DNA-binding protein [Actinomycetota bacterium]|nr:DNA-binding protein [Actinomycetota bacterium]